MKHEILASTWGVQRLIFGAALAAFLIAVWFIPIGHDQVWAIWIGRQLLGGAVLYKDIIEVNPPLWFWLATPQAMLGLEAATTVRLFFAIAIGLSLWLTPAKYRLPSLVAFVLLSLHDFGQREHFTLIATVPYVFMCAQRLRGEEPSHPVLIAAFAAFGLALKPYFIVVPVALELALWRQSRRRPEVFILLYCATLYALLVQYFTPDYMAKIVPELMVFYGYFSSELTYRKLTWAVALAVIGAVLGKRSGSPESRLLALTALAFLPAVVLQAKGWSYQTIPVRGFLFLAIVVDLMRERRWPWADAFLVASAALCFLPFGTYRSHFAEQMNPHLEGLPPGTTITSISPNPSAAWPMVETRHLTWTSPQFSTWQIFAAKADPRHVPAVQRVVAAELEQAPEIIVVDRRKHFAGVVDKVLPGAPDGYRERKRTRLFTSYQRGRG